MKFGKFATCILILVVLLVDVSAHRPKNGRKRKGPKGQEMDGRKQEISGTKIGVCPVAESEMMGICIEECSDDEGCPDSKKCCNNPCGGNQCMDPVESLPGESATANYSMTDSSEQGEMEMERPREKPSGGGRPPTNWKKENKRKGKGKRGKNGKNKGSCETSDDCGEGKCCVNHLKKNTKICKPMNKNMSGQRCFDGCQCSEGLDCFVKSKKAKEIGKCINPDSVNAEEGKFLRVVVADHDMQGE